LNQETDSAVLEAAKNDPGILKYQADHCKLMAEYKAIIDTYIHDGFDITAVDCIQVCGLEMIISNLALSAPGVYVGNEVFSGAILGTFSGVEKVLEVAMNLLLFKVSFFIKTIRKLTFFLEFGS
jgi:hypothetical protein